MDRCEGIKHTKLISATGLRLTSFTIGTPRPVISFDEGLVFTLQIPVSNSGLPDPDVIVKAVNSTYLMTPLRLGPARLGWKSFAWGGGVIRREKIASTDLRATALTGRTGDQDQRLPVKFAPARAYNLVITSNGPLPVAYVRILGPGSRLIKECSGTTLLETELLCRWDGRNDPAGTYLLVARSADSGNTLLNVSLRHDPSWLEP